MSAAVALGASLKKGRMKIALIAVVVLLLLGAGVAYVATRSTHVEDDEDEVDVVHPAKSALPAAFDPKTAPLFLPLEAFTVNLADRDADRFAQIGVTLEVEDTKAIEQIKAFMPAIRNNILMLLSTKSAEAIRDEQGKRRLAAEMRAQALRPLGYDLSADELMEDPAAAAHAPRTSRKSRRAMVLPIKSVHFSNFIVQ